MKDMKDIMVDAAGQSSDLSQSFMIAGAERPHPGGPGFVLVARRLAPNTIEITSNKNGHVFATVRYAVSSDGRSLVSTALDMTGAECQQSLESAEIWTASMNGSGRHSCSDARAEPVSRP
jgi:hypothetical protein